MALTVGTDTYLSVAEADTYFAGQLGAASWSAASAGQKEAALRMACTRLERLFYQGTPTSTAQALQWPRAGLYDLHGAALPSDEVPACVKDAQCQEALALLQWEARGAGDSERERLQAQGVAGAHVGDAQESYRPPAPADPLTVCLCPRAFLFLRAVIAWSPSGSS